MNLTLLVTGSVIAAFRTGDLMSRYIILADIFPISLDFFSLDSCFFSVSTGTLQSLALFFINSSTKTFHILNASFSTLLRALLAFF